MTRPALLFSALILAAAAANPAVAQSPSPTDRVLTAPPREAAAVGPWADRLFDRLDADDDGQITGAELMILSRGEIAARGGSRIRALVSRSDASNDARVTREELASGAARMFQRMDVDGDGRLSEGELPQPSVARPAAPPPMPAADPMPMPGMEEGDDD